MNLNLIEGVNLQIGGEAGKFQTLPIEVLIKISQSLQNLVQNIAELEVKSPFNIDKNNFKIELAGFRKGSAIPMFILTPRIIFNVSEEGVLEQRKFVEGRFNKLMEIADKGDYSVLKTEYSDNFRRNKIAASLSDFTNSSGNAPMYFAEFNGVDKPKVLSKVNPLRPKVLSSLIVDIKENQLIDMGEDEFGVGRFKYSVGAQGRKKRTVIDEIKDNNAELSISFNEIQYFGTLYKLNVELQCLLSKEDDYLVIENKILDIVGTGENLEYAKNSFAEEFDYIFKRYNELKDSELTIRIRLSRDFINMIVKEII